MIRLLVLLALLPQAMAMTEPSGLVAANRGFAATLYAELAKQDGNLFFSPYSISLALGMAYSGARGETAAEMARVLHLEQVPDLPAATAGLLRMNTKADEADTSITLETANALWLDEGFRVDPAYQRTVTEQFRGEASVLEFDDSEAAAKRINGWVGKRTHEKITQILPADAFDEMTRAVLANAVYFYGSWKRPFEPSQTRPQAFYVTETDSVTVPMMRKGMTKTQLRYGEADRYQVLELPYGQGSFGMMILLPRSRAGLAGVEARIADGLLDEANSLLEPWEATYSIQLPKFKLEQSLSLVETLQALGMRAAFSNVLADFSGISAEQRPVISEVVHKAFVDVSEQGTEAAAVTGVHGMVMAMPPERSRTVEFIVDHPFMFAIRNQVSGQILFMGRVVNPAES